MAYNDLVVNFLRRPDIFDLIPRRFHQPIMPDLRALIEAIQMAGTSAMDELASRPRMLDLAIILRCGSCDPVCCWWFVLFYSLFDREINNPHLLSAPRQHTVTPLSTERRAFEEKLSAFRNQLDMLGFAQSARIKWVNAGVCIAPNFGEVEIWWNVLQSKFTSRVTILSHHNTGTVWIVEVGFPGQNSSLITDWQHWLFIFPFNRIV